jgi:hypothetical protein
LAWTSALAVLDAALFSSSALGEDTGVGLGLGAWSSDGLRSMPGSSVSVMGLLKEQLGQLHEELY